MHDLTLVDVHAHFTTERYIAVAKAAGHRAPDGMPEDYWPGWDPAEHVAMMDRTGVATSILSVSSPGVQLAGVPVRDLAAEMNDVAAAAVRAHPGRFGFFASLPVLSAADARDEIHRAFDELHANGAVLMSNTDGAYLGDPRLEPVLAELDRRGAALFLHPTSPIGFAGFDIGRPAPMIEFLFDTARTVVDFALSGAVTRFPDIRLIIPHAGGVIPLLVSRVDAFQAILGTGSEPVGQVLARAWWDLAGMPTEAQLHALAAVAKDDMLVYGSDYNWSREDLVHRMAAALDAALPNGWRTRTAVNARRLLA